MSKVKSKPIKTCFLLLALGFLIMCNNKDPLNYTDMETENLKGIVISNETPLKIDPIEFASQTVMLNKGDTVKILGISKGKTWLGKSENYWYKVKTGKSIFGWIFGDYIKIFSGEQTFSIENYVTKLYKGEVSDLRKKLAGIWWSIDEEEDFTRHGLEIYQDGNYKSFMKGGKVITGKYKFDFTTREIIFKNNTSFGDNLKFVRRGNIYHLTLEKDDLKLRFKKISSDLPETIDGKTLDEVKQESSLVEKKEDKNKTVKQDSSPVEKKKDENK